MLATSSGLAYPVRYKIIAKYFGQLSLVLAVINLVPFCSSIFFREPHIALRYATVIGIYFLIGASLSRLKVPRNMQANEGMVLIVSMLLFACLFTAYPIMGKGLSFVNAFFEVVSALTATGLSTVTSVVGAPRSFLFERAWMEWYGTLGFVTVAVFLIMQPELSHKLLDDSQIETKDLAGGTRAHARLIIKVSCLMLAASVLGCWVLGLKPFEALLYGMAASCTGGFAPRDSGIADLGLPLQIWICIICLMASIPLTIYGRYWQKLRNFRVDFLQCKTLIILCVIFAVAIILCMYFKSHLNIQDNIDKVFMLVVQTQTASGFSTAIAPNTLDPGSKLVLMFSMLIGGSVGSTAGGIKILRLLFLITVLNIVLKRICMPQHAVVVPRIAGIRIEDSTVLGTLLLIILFLAIIVISWFMFLLFGYDAVDALVEIVSAISTTGLSVGITNASLPLLLKAVLCLDMLFGRLEILAWLLVLYPKTWFGERLEQK